MTTFVHYIYSHRRECNLFQITRCFNLNCTPITVHVHILPFVRVAKKMSEEEERATLDNYVDSSILELLLI